MVASLAASHTTPCPKPDRDHREVLTHNSFERPPHPTPRQPSPRLHCPAHVLAPHMTALDTAVPAQPNTQHGGSPAERLVGQITSHHVPSQTATTAIPAPVISVDDTALQHRPARSHVLTGHLQPDPVKPTEHGQTRRAEDSVGHVEVFQMGGVRTSILGRPRPPQPAATPEPLPTPSIGKNRHRS